MLSNPSQSLFEVATLFHQVEALLGAACFAEPTFSIPQPQSETQLRGYFLGNVYQFEMNLILGMSWMKHLCLGLHEMYDLEPLGIYQSFWFSETNWLS